MRTSIRVALQEGTESAKGMGEDDGAREGRRKQSMETKKSDAVSVFFEK